MVKVSSCDDHALLIEMIIIKYSGILITAQIRFKSSELILFYVYTRFYNVHV